MRASLGMVHGSSGMMGAWVAHLNGLGCHFITQCKEKSNNADLSKKRRESHERPLNIYTSVHNRGSY